MAKRKNLPRDGSAHEPVRAAAVALSLVMPGLGHAYLGAWRRGAIVLSASFAVVFAAAAALPIAGRWWWVLVPILVSPTIATTLDAFRARATPSTSSNRTILRLVIGVLGLLATSGVVKSLLVDYVLRTAKVAASSMLPTLRSGDHLAIDMKSRSVARGDLLVFQSPENREQEFVKRVAAIEDDTIEVRDGRMVINGFPIPTCDVGTIQIEGQPATVFVEFLDGHAHLALRGGSLGPVPDFGPYFVGTGDVIVIGDNRDSSHDSRGWFGGRGGAVPESHRRGKAFAVWLSFAADGSIAWSSAGFLSEPRMPDTPELAPGIERCLASPPPSTVPRMR